MSFDTLQTHVTTLTSADMDLPISQNSASVKGSYHVLRSKDKYNSASYDSLSTYKSGNLGGGAVRPRWPALPDSASETQGRRRDIDVYAQLAKLQYVPQPQPGFQVDDRNFWSRRLLLYHVAITQATSRTRPCPFVASTGTGWRIATVRIRTPCYGQLMLQIAVLMLLTKHRRVECVRENIDSIPQEDPTDHIRISHHRRMLTHQVLRRR